MLWIVDAQRKRIAEHTGSLIKADPMLCGIGLCLGFVPFENKRHFRQNTTRSRSWALVQIR